jgi:DNA-binding transcriptional ArsR family regulator
MAAMTLCPPAFDADQLDAVFSALADPTRRAIVARLAQGETSVKELAKPFKISGPAVTKHLKVLQNAGLIARSRRAQQRPCRLVPRPLQEANYWVEQYRKLWENRLDRLEDYLMELQGKDRIPRAPRRKSHGERT